MHASKIIDDYIQLIKSDEEKYYKDYQVLKEMVSNSTAYYKGKPVPFNYQPFFLDQIDLENFNYILDSILKISNKVINEYKETPEYRKLFNFPKFIEDMILVDNKYDVAVPMGRFDIFYKSKDDFKFCEINTDGSSAMNEDAVLSQILLQSHGLKDFSKDYKLKSFELFDTWVEECLNLYEKYDPNNKTPNVAIMDVLESASTNEFEEFKKAFERAGLDCEIVDVRNLEYKDGHLYHKDFKIDLIYRRLVTFELIENKEDCKDFIDAYMDGAMCTIGSIQSQIIHNKIFFKILFDEETRAFLDDEDIDFIDKHIPYTGIFGGSEDVFEKVKNDKDNYIIKPMDKNASTGVYTGLDFSQEEWEEKLKEDFDKDTIYQEFVKDMTIPFVDFDENGKVIVEDLTNTVGIFSYNEKVAGLYPRMGKDNIIAGLTDYITAPGILAIRRDMKDLIPRINELSKISKERNLTAEETMEREALRHEYILRFRSGMEEELMTVKVVDEEGNDITKEKLRKLYEAKKKRW